MLYEASKGLVQVARVEYDPFQLAELFSERAVCFSCGQFLLRARSADFSPLTLSRTMNLFALFSYFETYRTQRHISYLVGAHTESSEQFTTRLLLFLLSSTSILLAGS